MTRAVRARAHRALPFVKFATDILKLTLSAQWRVLLLVAVDHVPPSRLDEGDREIARVLFGDVDDVPESARKILILRLGRGSGKSTIAAALCLWFMWTAPGTWGVGQIPAAVVVAPSKDTAAISVTIGRELARNSVLDPFVIAKTDAKEGFSIRRPDGRVVQFRAVAASRGGSRLRGFDLLCLILDESEFFLSNADAADGSGYSVSDRDLVGAAMPRLLGPCLLVSTPWPSENLTEELFAQNYGAPTTALAALGASVFMRPENQRLAQDAAREKERDPENHAREYECESSAKGSSHIFVEGLTEAIDRDRPVVLRALPGAFVGIGGDLALERDSSVVAAVSLLGGLYTLLEFDEVKPSKGAPLSPGYVIKDRFAPVMRAHGASSMMADGHYRQSAVEHLTPLGLSFVDAPTGAQGKFDSHMHVRALLRTGMLKLPNSSRLIAQMRAVVATPLPGGGTKITSPRRAGSAGHGDIVSALVAGVWHARMGISASASRVRLNTKLQALDDVFTHGMAPGERQERTAAQTHVILRGNAKANALAALDSTVPRSPGLSAKDAAAWDRRLRGEGSGREESAPTSGLLQEAIGRLNRK